MSRMLKRSSLRAISQPPLVSNGYRCSVEEQHNVKQIEKMAGSAAAGINPKHMQRNTGGSVKIVAIPWSQPLYFGRGVPSAYCVRRQPATASLRQTRFGGR